MNTILKTVQVGGLTALFALATVVMPVSNAFANPNGNNGTLKVHEQGTKAAFINNDPKVCVFNFEGFKFDVGQTGYINIEPQGGSQPVGEAVGPISFGETNANGYAETEYFNTENGVQVKNGMYKATLYGKDTGGNIDLKDVKAKSKVFKVNCEEVTEEPVVDEPDKPVIDDVDEPDVLGTDTEAGKGSALSTSTELANTGANQATMISTIIGVVLFAVTAVTGLVSRKKDDITYLV